LEYNGKIAKNNNTKGCAKVTSPLPWHILFVLFPFDFCAEYIGNSSKHFYYNIWIIYSSHGNGFYGILKQLPAYNGGKASQIIRGVYFDARRFSGFDSLSYFNCIFKRKYGVSPGIYRKV